MLLIINKKPHPQGLGIQLPNTCHLICLILSIYIRGETDSTVKHSKSKTKQPPAFVWLAWFFHCNRLVRMPPPAPGGKTMSHTCAEMRHSPQEGLHCVARQQSCNWIWGRTALIGTMTGGDGGPSALACWADQIKGTAGQSSESDSAPKLEC